MMSRLMACWHIFPFQFKEDYLQGSLVINATHISNIVDMVRQFPVFVSLWLVSSLAY